MATRAYVLVLNWNGWEDTLECLESVFRSGYPDVRVLVCDNDSTDGSLDRIKAWAEGRLSSHVFTDNPLCRLSCPPVRKPIVFAEYDREAAESGGDLRDDPPLVLIRTGANLGFAGGNNVGLRYVLARGDGDHVWLLNNDTVVEPDALSHLVERLAEEPSAGLCGSTLLDYAEPDRVQALGGFTYNRWLGTVRKLGGVSTVSPRSHSDVGGLEARMFGVQGASVMVTRDFLERVGLLEEEYFLYFEEQDWAVRARRAGKSLCFAPRSRVYHKEGASTGGKLRGPKTALSDYYTIRSRLLFTRKFFPYAYPVVLAGLGVTMIRRLLRGQPERVRMVFRIVREVGRAPG